MAKHGHVMVNGSALNVYQAVMDEMKLVSGQNVSEKQLWDIIELNAAAFVGEMEALREQGAQGIPDTSSLAKLLAR